MTFQNPMLKKRQVVAEMAIKEYEGLLFDVI